MLVLFETSVGYAIFKVSEMELLSQKDYVGSERESWVKQGETEHTRVSFKSPGS